MRNLSMKARLDKREAIDLSKHPRTELGDYVLTEFTEGVDYCDAAKEQWIWSIGQSKTDPERILASTTTRFYGNPDFTCLFLR